MSQPILQVEHLKKYFPAGGRKVLRAVDDVSFSVQEGEILGIVGESGCGKTTCGRTAIGLYSKTDGVSLYRGEDVHRMRGAKRRAFCCQVQTVFQDPYASLDPKNKVIDLIAEGMDIHHLYTGPAERREKVQALMEQVGLNPSGIDRYPYEFSGGMRQRIGIARALIVEPEFIVADEPISALDMSIRAQVLNLLRRLQKERSITYLFIAHDLSVMRYISDRIAVIHKGSIVELADAEELVAHAIHPYTRSLLSAIPMPDPRRERNKKLLVYDPAMHDYSTEAPQWRELRPRHWVLCSAAEAAQWLPQA